MLLGITRVITLAQVCDNQKRTQEKRTSRKLMFCFSVWVLFTQVDFLVKIYEAY
jgi:hypothetical protein